MARTGVYLKLFRPPIKIMVRSSGLTKIKESIFSGIREGFKSFSEGSAVNRVLSTYMISYMTSFPESEHFRINETTSLKCLARPEQPIGSVLILQGGVDHVDKNTYYVRTACSLLPGCARVFLYEKSLPVVNFEFSHDIALCLDYVRKNFPGPVVVIGYSMGGVLLYNYLALGYNQADLYIPVCCPLDLERFYETICNHTLFNYLQERTFLRYQVDNYEDLLKLAGSSKKQHQKFIEGFVPQLNKQTKWQDKTIYIVSSDDPITPDYRGDLAMLDHPPLTYQVKGGWHCCLNSIFLSTQLAGNYLQACHCGDHPTVEEINPDEMAHEFRLF